VRVVLPLRRPVEPNATDGRQWCGTSGTVTERFPRWSVQFRSRFKVPLVPFEFRRGGVRAATDRAKWRAFDLGLKISPWTSGKTTQRGGLRPAKQKQRGNLNTRL